VPFERFNFFGKQLYFVGPRDFFDTMLVMGDIEKWDFVAIYAFGTQVKAVCGTPSRNRQLSVLREAFRVNCMPSFEDLLSGYWSIDNLVNLIKVSPSLP
jgi:hypothetical protein